MAGAGRLYISIVELQFMGKNGFIPSKSWFTVVEMEICTHCNRKCSYCPASILQTIEPPKYMSDEVFDRLLNELRKINFFGRISYNIFNEPLLRNDLERFVARIKETLPDSYQLLFTNGDFLSEERYRSLKEAGINHFRVTMHSFTPIPERPLQTIQYPTDINLNNCGGTLSKLNEPLDQPCFGPSEMLIVTSTGNVLLCCNDGTKNQIMGNLMKRSLEEIWFSKKFIWIRKLLKNGRRCEGPTICRNCDATNFVLPGKGYNDPQNWV